MWDSSCRESKMKHCSEQPVYRPAARGGFTLVEVVASILILSGILATTMVVMNRCVSAVVDQRNRERAFELARENLEFLLTSTQVKDGLEYGFDEINPEVQWQLAVEPFYEPVSNRMWIRAVSTAEYTDTKGEIQAIELEHWITGLTAQQIKMIQAQQKLESEFLDNFYGENETQRQELNRAFLEQKDLDVEAYDQFLDRQRQRKISYLKEYGSADEGYTAMLEELREEEDQFLIKLGVKWEEYQDFYTLYLGETNEYMSLQADQMSEEQTPAAGESSGDEVPSDLPPEILKMLEM
jgi:type II secretory pathway pseudopilin PulG